MVAKRFFFCVCVCIVTIQHFLSDSLDHLVVVRILVCTYFGFSNFFVDFDLLVIIFWDTALCIFECLVTSKTCLGVLTLFLFIHFC